jgi:uncharacterized protein (TIGR03083 family)
MTGEPADEFASAEEALAVLHQLVQPIGPDELHCPTPCRDWDVQALAEHLVDTISRLGVAVGIPTTVPDADSIDQRIQQVTQPILAEWRRRGLTADVVFSGRTLPAQLAQSRSTAGFDPPVPVPADASPLDQLVGFTGRDPALAGQ